MVTDERSAAGLPQLCDDALGGAWQTALRLAWDGLRAQTTPVGAVVTDEAGRLIAAGRGRRYERAGPAGQLAGSHVAHAEVNALAQLSAGRDWPRAIMLTTLEPCGMCHGAAVQSTIARVYFAGRDPYGGTAGLRFDTPQSRQRELMIAGPLPDARGTLAEIMYIAFLLSRNSAAHVIRAQEAILPRLTSYTRQVLADLHDAVRRNDYHCAVDISAQAPRD